MSEPFVDVTRISTKGQVVIPKELREKMGLEHGTRLHLLAVGDLIILHKVETRGGLGAKELISKAKSILEKFRLR